MPLFEIYLYIPYTALYGATKLISGQDLPPSTPLLFSPTSLSLSLIRGVQSRREVNRACERERK